MTNEEIAARLWKAEAEDTGTPQSVVVRRTPEAFREQGNDVRARFLRYAKVIRKHIDDETARKAKP